MINYPLEGQTWAQVPNLEPKCMLNCPLGSLSVLKGTLRSPNRCLSAQFGWACISFLLGAKVSFDVVLGARTRTKVHSKGAVTLVIHRDHCYNFTHISASVVVVVVVLVRHSPPTPCRCSKWFLKGAIPAIIYHALCIMYERRHACSCTNRVSLAHLPEACWAWPN